MGLRLPELRVSPLNAHYEGEYSESMLRWRELGAADKVRNLKTLLGARANEVQSVIEVGTGTGAVILKIAQERIGQRHVGTDIADPADHAHPGVLESGVELVASGGTTIPFPDNSFDLVVASHVLEHVADERGFLAELARLSRRWIYIEVPCEIVVRTSQRMMQASLDIGHINAYTPETFKLTLVTSGLKPVDFQIFDHSDALYRFNDGRVKAGMKAFMRRSTLRLNPLLASRIFAYHVGALCEVEAGGA